MTFQTIHTQYGLSRMAQAEASGLAVNLTHMAVGDGAGHPTEPSELQESLVREWYRAPINRVYQNPDRPTQYLAELVVPKSAGGRVMREFGVFDDAGGLFVVGNIPDVYLPADGEGAFTDAIIRCVFEVSNAAVVNIMVDPNVAMASQAWVLNTVSPASLIPGGLVNQVLAKQSNADGDTVWIDLTEVNVVVDVIEEPQTLAADQTQVDLSITTTDGLAVYIEGLRLQRGPGEDQWQVNPVSEYTSLILGQAYPAGTRIVMVQNDPMGNATEPLAKSQNLADVPDTPLARENLGVFSKAESRQFGPTGEVAYFARTSAPTGWLKCNGAEVSRTAYADLFAIVGTAFGAGDGVATFRVPDLRGEFLRGMDDGRGIDPGRALGSLQFSANLSHSHSGSTNSAGAHTHGYSWEDTDPGSGLAGGSQYRDRTRSGFTASSGSHSHGFTTNSAGGSESRPRNIALLACIKY